MWCIIWHQDCWTLFRQRLIASRGGRRKRWFIELMSKQFAFHLNWDYTLYTVYIAWVHFYRCAFFRYALQGSRWKTKDLTYKITKYPRGCNSKIYLSNFNGIIILKTLFHFIFIIIFFQGLSKKAVDETIAKAFKVGSDDSNVSSFCKMVRW